MRIIAGSARGRTIQAPKGQDTRPTQDYVRESLFNILQRDIPDATVLDLFAGSGALALEALSRGAAYAVLADQAAKAVACIRANVALLKMDAQTLVLQSKWQDTLQRLSQELRTFSIVFLDPPYKMAETDAICIQLRQLGLLEQGALIVIEHRTGSENPPDARFTLRNERRYGDTTIHIYVYQGEEKNNA
ncbi:MAG: 16S rRNA (guanine(966)-N(2))-methyltransferase RsmD [Eubacteriales bacterium]|nr:16S rRNA (guanine(966)-N(2))-methyltransferase RsmD [Eubacteriales bacterium]